MKYPRKWEEISDSEGLTARLKVPGGWIVQQSNLNFGTAMCFVPDPDYKWILEDTEDKI